MQGGARPPEGGKTDLAGGTVFFSLKGQRKEKKA